MNLPLHAADEAPIDTSLTHYMEERALAIAAQKATDAGQRAKVEHLLALRAGLMARRTAYLEEATARRHARGEIYSASRVAAINAMGPTQAGLEAEARTLYAREPDTVAVLKTHALTHFAFGLVSSRLLLASMTPDILEAARTMQRDEEAFAGEWLAAIGDAAFTAALREQQRTNLRDLRTSTRPMHLMTQPEPASTAFGDADAEVLGKNWNRLDDLARELGVEPLSNFIALPDEALIEGSAVRVLAIVEALLVAVQAPARKLPSKRATVVALVQIRDTLKTLGDGARAAFDVDL